MYWQPFWSQVGVEVAASGEPLQPSEMYTTTFFKPPSAPATTFSVVTGFALCTAAQAGSFDMSIGLWWGAVPSSLTVPAIPPSGGGAALTDRCDLVTTNASISTAERVPITVYK